MGTLAWVAIFAVAVTVLVKAADFLTDGAEELGVYLGIPPYVVGVTIVAVGTSLPELVSSLFGVYEGVPEIVAANVVGSNITNVFLVLGVAAIIARRLEVGYEIINVDLPMLAAAAAFVGVVCWDGTVTRPEGMLLVAGGTVYLLYAINISRQRGRLHEALEEDVADEFEIVEGKLDPLTWPRIIGGAVLLFFSAEYTIRSVIELSGQLGVPAEIITISAVAIGTSLPELVVSARAARRGSAEVAIGNVLGSSVFNSFAVLGIPALIVPLPVEPAVLLIGIPFMIIATVLCFFMAQDREMTRWEGWLLVLLYVLFLGKLFELV